MLVKRKRSLQNREIFVAHHRQLKIIFYIGLYEKYFLVTNKLFCGIDNPPARTIHQPG